MKRAFIASVLVMLPTYVWLQGDKPPALQTDVAPTHHEWMNSIQQQLTQDPNQAELWFQLGHGYLNQQDFSSALTCFDYALRLSDTPTANQLAAKATSLYYLSNQTMTTEVQQLLKQALDRDPYNWTALALIAGDHFISLRYQEAIDAWTLMLDNAGPSQDRVGVIQSLNQAKSLVSNAQ
ncbi:tetratricopeptide repeat protein [Vibrio sinaloensis]|uniref:tetratricopeptide repeat protein n=1 Tax=Photobacterium sp. (strain ATCC 43367) TaxID=379097 RepID=UPI002063E784|nr:tetratricopeptide repeat protein [Vibrio sinaloensis]UPQ87270.1 tetratricopeptide repeat protein [Vibrio sinaloensis]